MPQQISNNGRVFLVTRYTIFLLMIVSVSVIIRFYFYPLNLPLIEDSLYYFWYSSDIYQIGKLPENWSPTNNGWPIFVSLFFSIFDSKDIFTLMDIQKTISVILSLLLSIPVYVLCKKFVDKKYALIGAALIAFEPRLMINSFLGTTDPLYLLLVTTSLTLFLFSNKKTIILSFILVAFATTIRGEGFVFFLVLSIMYFVKNRSEKNIIFRYLLLLGIFILIILPISLYRVEVTGGDGILIRGVVTGEQTISALTSNGGSQSIFDGLELFGKYFIWILIPNFIIFVPLGFFLIFKNRNFEKNTIILSIGIMILPVLFAYTVIFAQDTRYLYTLFPMFSVLSVLSIDRILRKSKKSNLIIVIIILSIFVSSVLFYDYQKTNYQHEKESFEIMTKISSFVTGINPLYQETSYLVTSQTIEFWPKSFKSEEAEMKKIQILSMDNFDSLEKYIIESKSKGLSHIIVDERKDRNVILVDIFYNEENYSYLKKIYDSKKDGYNYHVKVFEINYDNFK